MNSQPCPVISADDSGEIQLSEELLDDLRRMTRLHQLRGRPATTERDYAVELLRRALRNGT